ncbi:MAG: hypothetical protein ABI548_04615 [Polyangiaceae bacterium]
MNAYDLDNPLRVDNCDRCGALNWRECICDSSRPFRQPTQIEIERARDERLTLAELSAEVKS